MGPTAKGLILDLLSTVRSGSMPVRLLIAAGELFDIDDNRIRVTLARLLAEGLIERDQRGAYRPGPASRGVQSLVAGWKHTEERMMRWDGNWIAALTGATARSERIAVRRNERALARLGFRPLERNVALRPANLTDGIEGARRRLREVGLDHSAVVVGMSDFDPETERRARALWDGDALSKQYDRTIIRLDTSRRRLPALSERRAMIESFTLGGSAIRQIVRDPLLPSPFMPAGALGRLVRTMRSYDEAGRASWRGFLERHGIDFLHPPMHLSGVEGSAQATGAAR